MKRVNFIIKKINHKTLKEEKNIDQNLEQRIECLQKNLLKFD